MLFVNTGTDKHCYILRDNSYLLPLGHLECPSRGATTPWAKSNMGELLPPEDN